MRHETHYVSSELIIVKATIAGPRATTQVRMLVDTGALMTTLNPEVLDRPMCPRDARRRTKVHSAVGEEEGYELLVASFTAIGFTANDVLVNVFDLGHDDIVDGLIGMSWLNGFNVEIRPAEKRLLVERIDP
jgi:predicted aspartyl protease